ncbi:hypothetical protein ACFX2C_040341 [Malus domestica]
MEPGRRVGLALEGRKGSGCDPLSSLFFVTLTAISDSSVTSVTSVNTVASAEIIVEEWKGSSSTKLSRTATITASHSLSIQRSGSLFHHVWRRILEAVVPEGFPSNVTPDFVPFQQSDRDPPQKMKGKSHRFTIELVTAWYSSNIGVLLLNKYLLSNYGFKYLIFLTMCHMSACSLLSYIAIAWMKIRSRVQFLKIAALSLVFGVSVVFWNISLQSHHCK